MLIALIIVAVFLGGGGGMWIVSQVAGYLRDRKAEVERERINNQRAIETERALRETLVIISERTSCGDRAKAA